MKQKKEFKYYLKKGVRDDLINLSNEVNYLILRDNEGFDFVPCWSILPALFKVYSHLVWCTKFQSWFKKVYE